MKIFKYPVILLLNLIAVLNAFSQDIASDTVSAKQYYLLGDKYYEDWNIDSSSIYYLKAANIYKQIAEKNNDTLMWEKHIRCLYDVSWNLKSQSQFERSIYLLDSALNLCLNYLKEKHLLTATLYVGYGNVYSDKAEFNKALEYYFKSLKTLSTLYGDKHPKTAVSYNNIGIVYDLKGEYDKSLEYYFKGLEIRLELFGEIHRGTADSYNNIGLTCYNKGEYDKALEYHFKSLEIRLKLFGDNHPIISDSYNNIGMAYDEKGEYDKALKYYFKALKIQLELLDEIHTEVAMSYNNIGGIYGSMGEYDKSLEYFFKNLKILSELLGEQHTDVAMAYNNIGMVYDLKAEYDKASEYYFKALKIRLELLGKKHPDVADSYNNIGISFSGKDEYNKALKYFQKALSANLTDFEDATNVSEVPVIKNYMSYVKLLISLQEKAKIFASNNPTGLGSRKDLKILALHHYQSCDSLIDQVRKSMNTKSDKIALGEKAFIVYDEAINECVKLSDLFETSDEYDQLAFYFSEKNKSSVLLEALAGSEAQKFAGIPDSLLQKEHNLKVDITFYNKELAQAEYLDSLTVVLFKNRLFNCNRSYDSLIVIFEKQYPKYHDLKYNKNTTTVNKIQNLLNKRTAMISYMVGDSALTVFTITKKSFDVKQIDKLDNLLDTIELFRESLTVNSPYFISTYKRLSYKLYQLLFPENIDKKIKTLIIIPDNILATFPFEVLLTNKVDNSTEFKKLPYLIRDYAISYTYSATLFDHTFTKRKSKTVEITPLNDWLAFAPVFNKENNTGLLHETQELQKRLTNINNDTSAAGKRFFAGDCIAELPATEDETKAIFKEFESNKLKAKILLHKSANEQYVKSGDLENYKILHFATHGFVNSEIPELSGIILAQNNTGNEDGILYSGEIFNLKLNADLVVLSACETGLGKIKKGEGIIGLTRALLYAGTKNIIVSLWQVSDDATSQLMIDFYDNFVNRKRRNTFTKDLNKAKLKMINEGKYAHPFFWSPFILIGK